MYTKRHSFWGDILNNFLENHLPLRDKIYKLIRKSILNRELKPGYRVTELELSKKYGISRTPIREAFRRLESEGFLTIIPRKGAAITEIKEQTVIEFYQIKGALESLAGKLALKNISQDDIKELEHLNSLLKKFKQSSNDDSEALAEQFNKIHNSFHEKIINLSGNLLLMEILDRLTKKYMRFRLMVEHTNFINEVIAQHQDIIDSLKKGDINLVEQTISKNANLGIDLIKNYYIKED